MFPRVMCSIRHVKGSAANIPPVHDFRHDLIGTEPGSLRKSLGIDADSVPLLSWAGRRWYTAPSQLRLVLLKLHVELGAVPDVGLTKPHNFQFSLFLFYSLISPGFDSLYPGIEIGLRCIIFPNNPPCFQIQTQCRHRLLASASGYHIPYCFPILEI